MELLKITYEKLGPKQQEIYNFQKVASCLADYGFNCIKLADDWRGADFLAYHVDGEKTLKVQLKGRITIDKKYIGKELYMAFPVDNEWYLIEHDKLVEHVDRATNWLNTESWERGKYSASKPNRALLDLISKYRVST